MTKETIGNEIVDYCRLHWWCAAVLGNKTNKTVAVGATNKTIGQFGHHLAASSFS